jgi:serine protease Do
MTNKLRDLSQEIVSLSKTAATRIVALYGRRGGIATGIVWSGDGLVAAASHTLEWDEGIDVVRVDGSGGRADIIGRDRSTDVALLRVKGLDLPDPKWKAAEIPDAGALSVVVAASPQGPRVELTNLTVVGDEWTASGGGRIQRYLESSLSIFRGFSGSPLLDTEGRLIGMNTTGLERRVSLAVPMETLQRATDSLLEHGRIRRGFLGVTTYPVRLPESAGQGVGLMVLAVQKESPAERAGLHLGDVLLAFDGTTIDSPMELLSRLTEERIGKPVELDIFRTGKQTKLEIEVTARP